jgi:hypothetical protein
MGAPLFNSLLFPSILGAAVAVWAADPVLAGGQSQPTVSPDPVLGTWHLNVAKSTFIPGPAPKSQTRTYEPGQDGIRATIRTVYADGHSAVVQFVSDYHGDRVPVAGSPDADLLALKRINTSTAEVVLFHADREVGSARRVISKDGRTMTITVQLTNAEGVRVNDTQVYEKEQKETREE